ncbi:MAG: SCO family protein [Alphaproteobacteria bacterium]|nr:SCO family protein [Alphaproteobacteria bacterium]MBV9553336.1 SCO family protein [Alphaproteobacteria bacterium]
MAAGARPLRSFGLIAAAAAAALVLLAGVLIAMALRDEAKGVAGGPLAAAIGGKFSLVDQNGKPFTDTDLKGKWQLVFFGYTHCPDVCPTALNDLSLALDQLGEAKKNVGIVFISVDPERDTPAVLKSYVESFGGPIEALTGTPAEVSQAAKDYKVYYAKHPRPDGGYDMDHSALIYIVDPQGRFTATFTPDDTADAMAARLRKLLS